MTERLKDASTQEACLDEELTRRLMLVGRLLSQRVSVALRPITLRPEQWMVLHVLADRERSPSAIARELFARKGTVSRWVADLQRKGLVEYCEVSGDKRCKLVALTDYGQNLLEQARERLAWDLESLGMALSADTRKLILDLGRRLSAASDRSWRGRPR